jgi:anti-anti-sigma factor
VGTVAVLETVQVWTVYPRSIGRAVPPDACSARCSGEVPVRLAVSVCDEGEAVRLVLVGDLDMSTVHVLVAAWDAAIDDHDSAEWIVAATGLTFVDSVGLRQLILMAQQAKLMGARFCVDNSSSPLRRIVELTMTGEVLGLN